MRNPVPLPAETATDIIDALAAQHDLSFKIVQALVLLIGRLQNSGVYPGNDFVAAVSDLIDEDRKVAKTIANLQSNLLARMEGMNDGE